ncbi:YdcF family protein [Acaryochloris sp. CCMEE 5410]|uniref:YdcF family protein n=1 Tax=Acaryochloris sp. CCMEE 5410 TaxID=310037 RepID=UPI00068155A8|nr:YdcF family protein [Acaryochloris sp. CCMEE 5410]KAI9130472.1 YdcF family protein [Acaryochloris sp. CCMEE 5410]
MLKIHRKTRKYTIIFLLGLCAALISIIPIRLTIAAWQAPSPQAILVLGGNPDREKSAAQIAQFENHLDIWISSGTKPEKALSFFQALGIERSRVHLDYQATDTVTNFTTLVPKFKQRRIQHIYVITSNDHMPRAKAIASIVLGSQGITFTPVYVPTNNEQEPIYKVLRDSGRSLIWVFTGFSGA